MEASPDNSVLAGIGNGDGRSFIYPLDGLYRYYQLDLPPFEQMEGHMVPEPYRSLLVHVNDMTPTLETFHNEKIWIRPEARYLDDDFYFREVILFLENSKKPVEYGAIVIHLENCPEGSREAILEARKPLGTLMKEHNIPHTSRPAGFFKIISDALISQRLEVTGNSVLYGRRNALITPGGNALAEIVEILPA